MSVLRAESGRPYALQATDEPPPPREEPGPVAPRRVAAGWLWVPALVTLLALAMSPFVAREIARVTNVDPFLFGGVVHTVSAHKLRVFLLVTVLLAAIALADLAWAVLRGARWRALAAIVALPLLFAPYALLREAASPAIAREAARFRIREVQPPFVRALADPTSPERSAVRTFAQLHDIARRAYADAGDRTLATIAHPDLRRAVFYVGIVSQLWGAGNVHDPLLPGCVRVNEQTSHATIAEDATTMRTYMDARIACCDDYAHFLKLFLDREGISSRLVIAGGHIFNEATIAGQPMLLDANIGLVLSTSWHALNRGADSVDAIAVALAQTRADEPSYRRTMWLTRISILLSVYRGGFQTRYADDVPPFLRRIAGAAS